MKVLHIILTIFLAAAAGMSVAVGDTGFVGPAESQPKAPAIIAEAVAR